MECEVNKKARFSKIAHPKDIAYFVYRASSAAEILWISSYLP